MPLGYCSTQSIMCILYLWITWDDLWDNQARELCIWCGMIRWMRVKYIFFGIPSRRMSCEHLGKTTSKLTEVEDHDYMLICMPLHCVTLLHDLSNLELTKLLHGHCFSVHVPLILCSVISHPLSDLSTVACEPYYIYVNSSRNRLAAHCLLWFSNGTMFHHILSLVSQVLIIQNSLGQNSQDPDKIHTGQIFLMLFSCDNLQICHSQKSMYYFHPCPCKIHMMIWIHCFIWKYEAYWTIFQVADGSYFTFS